jgi:hypothetical protein
VADLPARLSTKRHSGIQSVIKENEQRRKCPQLVALGKISSIWALHD